MIFGVIDLGNVSVNLMVVNVIGGVVSQCVDLLYDMKMGLMIGVFLCL